MGMQRKFLGRKEKKESAQFLQYSVYTQKNAHFLGRERRAETKSNGGNKDA